MSRNARTPTSRGRRIALSFGTAAGAALIAASFGLGNAPAARAVVDADPLTDLIGAFDPNAFSATDAPTDALGLLGYYIDTYLLGPTGLGAELDPIVDGWLTPSTSTAATLDADPLTDLIGAFDPNAFSATDAPTDALGLLGYYIDTYLLGPTGLGAELDPIVDGWLTPSTSTAATLDADPLTDLIGAFDPHALSAAGVSDTLALSYLIEAFDPHSFSSAGAPTDALGLLGYYTDTYLLGPTGLDAELAPLVQELVGTVTVTPPTFTDAISELIGALDPNAFSPTGVPVDALGLLGYDLDTYLLGPFGIDNLLAPYVADIIASLPSSAASFDVDPVSDLVAALDPSAFSAGVADLTAPTAVGLLDPVVDGLLNSGLSLF